MNRLAGSLLAILLLSSCTPGGLNTLQQNLTLAAQEQLKRTLAGHFTRELGKGVGTVTSALAQSGGYLDNPLVRILLPPPLGLALGVARDLHADPEAALLEVLMNQAAEQAIPGAGPILQTALAQITPADARRLLDGGKTAGTEYLKEKTAAALREALNPLISENLAVSGAQLVYGELIDAYQTQTATNLPAEPAVQEEPVHDLKQYVAEQAVEGLFKSLGAQETQIRAHLDEVTGGVLQGLGGTPAVVTPIEETPAVDSPAVDSPAVEAPAVETPETR